jgi:ankyrin repeat protein
LASQNDSLFVQFRRRRIGSQKSMGFTSTDNTGIYFIYGKVVDRWLVESPNLFILKPATAHLEAPRRMQNCMYNIGPEVVKCLLETGADINFQGGYYGNALQAASHHGHQEVVELLLENGAEINGQGGYFGNALQAAAYQGHQEVVKLLLGKGANVNAQGGEYKNSLHAASIQDHKEIVELLQNS